MKIIKRIVNGVPEEWHLPDGIDTPEQFIAKWEQDKKDGLIPSHYHIAGASGTSKFINESDHEYKTILKKKII